MLPFRRELRRILPAHGPGRVVSIFAILSLALGIAGNAIFFSWFDALVFEPLPYHEPDRLVLLGESQKGRRTLAMISMFTALSTWDDFRNRSETLEDWSAFRFRLLGVSQGDRSVSVMVGEGTAGLFRTLGVDAVRGRTFVEDDGREGAPGVAVVTWKFWTERGGTDSDLLGETLTLNGEPHRVVGVLPEDFELLVGNVDLWIPLRDHPDSWPRNARGVISVARMAYGSDLEKVRAEMPSISAELEAVHPLELQDWEMRAYHMASEFPDPHSRLHMATVQGLFFFVLLIACANVAMMLLARGEGRRREMALRSALGAGRMRIVGQHLRESLVMAALGGAVGLALTAVGVTLLSRVTAPTILPAFLQPKLDLTVVLFTVGMVVVAGVAFGLAPALQSLRQDDAETLKTGTGPAAGDGRGRTWVAGGLVTAEIALCLVALGGGSVLMRTFQSVRQSDPGFEADGLLVVEFGVPAWKHPDAEAWLRIMEELEARTEALPGVQSAGLVSQPPQALILAATDTFRVAGAGGEEGGVRPRAQLLWATPDYRRTLGMPLLAGRFFEDRDRGDAAPVVVVSESLSRRHFSGGGAVGARILVGGESREIVGVVGDVQQSLVPQAEGTLDGAIYMPRAQRPGTYSFLMVRTRDDPTVLAEPARRAIASVDRDITVHAAETHHDYARRFTAPLDVTNGFITLFGIFALLLASLGTYGVVAHAVARRTHELGVRLAVGARPGEVVGLIARRGLVMALGGLALGGLLLIPVVFFTGTILEGFALASVDLGTLVGVGVVLLVVTLTASFVPALRAARVDPVKVLRVE